MAIDLNSKEGRKKFISEYLDDLLTGVNESYGPILLEELQKRLEYTIDEFNEEINEAFSMLKKRDNDRKSLDSSDVTASTNSVYLLKSTCLILVIRISMQRTLLTTYLLVYYTLLLGHCQLYPPEQIVHNQITSSYHDQYQQQTSYS